MDLEVGNCRLRQAGRVLGEECCQGGESDRW